MCLGIPGQVVRMLDGYGDQLALVDVAGEHRKVNIGMLPEESFEPGDWVRSSMGTRFEEGYLFITRNTAYVLKGPRHRKSSSIQAIFSIF